MGTAFGGLVLVRVPMVLVLLVLVLMLLMLLMLVVLVGVQCWWRGCGCGRMVWVMVSMLWASHALECWPRPWPHCWVVVFSPLGAAVLASIAQEAG